MTKNDPCVELRRLPAILALAEERARAAWEGEKKYTPEDHWAYRGEWGEGGHGELWKVAAQLDQLTDWTNPVARDTWARLAWGMRRGRNPGCGLSLPVTPEWRFVQNISGRRNAQGFSLGRGTSALYFHDSADVERAIEGNHNYIRVPGIGALTTLVDEDTARALAHCLLRLKELDTTTESV